MHINPHRTNRYFPVEGGYRIRMGPTPPKEEIAAEIGACTDDPRFHRRPLYPPADRSVFFEKIPPERATLIAFRPLVLAFNAPRFLLEFHHAGGFLGHLLLGCVIGKNSLWLHEWSDIETTYVNGHMEYELIDARFPGTKLFVSAAPLSGATGVAIKWQAENVPGSASMVFCYGGASGEFFHGVPRRCQAYFFSPEQCLYDLIGCTSKGYSLHRKFDQPGGFSVYGGKPDRSRPPGCPEWEVAIQGNCAPVAETGFGAPGKVLHSPGELLKSAVWHAGGKSTTQANCVAVQRVRLSPKENSGYVAVGMGPKIEEVTGNLKESFESGLKRCESIAQRVTLKTPDPYLNASATMAAFGLEGMWGDLAYVHGGWSWRDPYLGWRIWYGPDCYGWVDRVKTSIKSHIRFSLIRKGEDQGGISPQIQYTGCDDTVSYNMHEVFLDHVRHYFDYTNDLELMREIFPALQGIIEWENRRLQPGNEGLYESALNTWISDSHWYIRAQCTQASAYMLRAHNFMALIAEKLGEDPSAWRAKARRIRAAMQKKLWMARRGVFAEALDTLGRRQLHPEPELATIYHSAEFGAADQLQIYQMCRWVDTHLRSELVAGGGKQYWSANWHPNRGRCNTHSTYMLVYAENLNYAQTNCLAGRADEAYALLRTMFVGMFNGPTPGGLSCSSTPDGRQEANDEFADPLSLLPRMVLEGLFGIVPKLPDGMVELSPQFPSGWTEASVAAPHFSYNWRRDGGHEVIEWKSPASIRVKMRLPVRANKIKRVNIDGKKAKWTVEPGVGFTWLIVETPQGTHGSIEVDYAARTDECPKEELVRPGDMFRKDFSKYGVRTFLDPQGILKAASLNKGMLAGKICGEPGPAVIFLKSDGKDCPAWIPLLMRVEPPCYDQRRIWMAPGFRDRDLRRWALIDLKEIYNASVAEVPERVAVMAKPPPLPASQVNFGYWLDHLVKRLSIGHRGMKGQCCGNMPVSDAAWRAKVGEDGIAWTSEGIPFKTQKEGRNIGVVTLAGGFPEKLDVPVNAKGRILYLMLSGVTWPMQSHVVNLRVTLLYANGARKQVDLVNPFDIGNCWDTWLGLFHDTAANGFENIGGRFGPAGFNESRGAPTGPVEVDTEAHLVPIEIEPGLVLKSFVLEAIANDVIFGVMGATVLRLAVPADPEEKARLTAASQVQRAKSEAIALDQQAKLLADLTQTGSARIDCGGEALYVDPIGRRWLPDQPFLNCGAYGNENAIFADRGNLPIANTDCPRVYQTEAWGDHLFYRIPVPNGNYNIHLHFAETNVSNKQAGIRLISIKVENHLWDKKVDPFAEAGGFARAVVLSEKNIAINGGIISIELTGGVGIQGIEIEKLP